MPPCEVVVLYDRDDLQTQPAGVRTEPREQARRGRRLASLQHSFERGGGDARAAFRWAARWLRSGRPESSIGARRDFWGASENYRGMLLAVIAEVEGAKPSEADGGDSGRLLAALSRLGPMLDLGADPSLSSVRDFVSRHVDQTFRRPCRSSAFDRFLQAEFVMMSAQKSPRLVGGRGGSVDAGGGPSTAVYGTGGPGPEGLTPLRDRSRSRSESPVPDPDGQATDRALPGRRGRASS